MFPTVDDRSAFCGAGVGKYSLNIASLCSCFILEKRALSGDEHPDQAIQHSVELRISRVLMTETAYNLGRLYDSVHFRQCMTDR